MRPSVAPCAASNPSANLPQMSVDIIQEVSGPRSARTPFALGGLLGLLAIALLSAFEAGSLRSASAQLVEGPRQAQSATSASGNSWWILLQQQRPDLGGKGSTPHPAICVRLHDAIPATIKSLKSVESLGFVPKQRRILTSAGPRAPPSALRAA